MTDDTRVAQPMIDEAQPTEAVRPGGRSDSFRGVTHDPGGRRGQPRHPARRSRIVAVVFGVAAMVGLVSNMEVSGSRAQAGDPGASPGRSSRRAEVARPRGGARAGKVVAAASRRPIVLTPHAVVHTVAVPAAAGSGGSGGYGYAAAAPAAAPASAPVATTSGSSAAP